MGKVMTGPPARTIREEHEFIKYWPINIVNKFLDSYIYGVLS